MTFDDPVPPVADDAQEPDELIVPPRRFRWALLASMIVVLMGGGAAAWVVLRDDGPSHPDEWDIRVLDLVEFVEEERGLTFDHPIHVDFLTDEEFRDNVTADEDALTDEEREEIEQFTGLMRAVGLVEGDVDLFAASNELSGGAVVGLYEFESQRIRVRGEELGVNARVTLVHELTHALQDQHFDIDRFEDLETDGEALAFRAVIEGDANRIEARYEEQLSEEDTASYDEEQQEEAQEVPPGLADVPDSLKAYFSAPYALGGAFVALIEELNGEIAIDELFLEPPTTEEQLFNPWVFIEGEGAIDIDVPELTGDEEHIDDGDFGFLTWYLMLAERLDPVAALDAVDGWGGDAYVAFVRDGITCARVAYVGDNATETEQMLSAVREWIGALPGDSASVEQDGSGFVLESCDPGAHADLDLPGRSTEVIGIPIVRTYVAVGALQDGARDNAAECFANELVHRFPVDRLVGENSAAEPNPDEIALLQEIGARCR
jgi:hypothetical protein